MPCPICSKTMQDETADHRRCVFQLLEENKIQSVEQWEALCKPKTIRKRTIKVRVPKE